MDVRKKDISKRSTFKKSDKKERRRKLQPGLNSDLSEPDSDSDLMISKKDKQMTENNMPSEGPMKTVSDYLNQIEDDYDAGNTIIESKETENSPVIAVNSFNEEINADEAENAEEWTPSLVSDDEIEAYMKEQYAWMEDNKPENELSMSLIFGGDDNMQYEETHESYHPEILENSEQVKDIKVKSSEGRGRKITGEPREIEIEIEDLTEYPEEQEVDIEPEEVAEEILQTKAEEDNKAEKRRPRKRRLRQGRDEAAALQDWVNAKSAESERKKQLAEEGYRREAYSEEEFGYSEQTDAIDDFTFDNENVANNINSYADEEIQGESIPVNEQNADEPSEEESVQPFDFTQTLEQAIARGDRRVPEETSEEAYEEEVISEELIELNEEAEIPIEPVFADMLSDEDEDDVLSIEEAEQYAQNFFVNNIAEPKIPKPDNIEEEQTAAIIEPVIVEEELTMPEKKEAELAELTRLIMQKNYPEAMKKVFAILNAGYVMTPDEKQKMRLVMLTLKAKT